MARQVSILICTRNRAPDLRETLASLAAISVPSDVDAQVIVVDNGSTDETSRVVSGARFEWGEVRTIVEPKPGVANARNRALAESHGDFIVFGDDDIRFSSDWLINLLAPFQEGADAVAGCISIAPHLRRSWMTPKHETMFASTRPAEEEGKVYLTGANMAFKRSVLEAVPGFDPRLGPGALGFSEESLFCDQLRQAGFNMVRSLNSIVEHHFRPDRLSRESLCKAGLAQGRSLAYIAYHWAHAEMPFSSLQLLRSKLGYHRRNLKSKTETNEGAEPFEIDYYTSLGYASQLKEEMKLPRRYTLRGLRLI